MFVERIEPMEKGRQRVSFGNGEQLILYQGEVRSQNLMAQTEISSEQYEELYYGIVGKRAKKRAMHLLERQDRTERQLRDKLQAGGYPLGLIDDAIAYLQTMHYLDDARYARNYIDYYKEKKSRRRIWQDLSQKGIRRELIEEAFLEFPQEDEREMIRSLLEKKHVNQEMSQHEARRLYQSLLQKGYQSSDILHVLRSEYLTSY